MSTTWQTDPADRCPECDSNSIVREFTTGLVPATSSQQCGACHWGTFAIDVERASQGPPWQLRVKTPPGVEIDRAAERPK